jgi:hypothetical protein
MWNRIGRTSAGAVNQSPLASRLASVQVVTPPTITTGILLENGTDLLLLENGDLLLQE